MKKYHGRSRFGVEGFCYLILGEVKAAMAKHQHTYQIRSFGDEM